MLSELQLLTHLGNPLDGQDAQTFSSEVWSVTGTERKKRAEILVATDTEGINIFNVSLNIRCCSYRELTIIQVRSSAPVGSYSIPPQQYFACAPHSLYIRHGSGSGRRLTYCALRSSNSDIKLQCFADTFERKGSPKEGFSTISKDISADNAPVYLDTITFEGSNILSLIVVFQNGDISICSEDLSDMVPISRSKGRTEANYATTLSVKQAKKGLLKKRPDLLVPFEGSANASSRILVSIGRPFDDEDRDSKVLRISIFSFQLPDAPTMDTSAPHPTFVGSFNVKTPISLPKTLRHCLHHSGQLYIWHRQRVVLYQLDGTPLEAQPVHDFPERIKSLLRLSSNLIAIIDDSSIKVVDFKHQAVSSSCILPATVLVNGDSATHTRLKDSERLLTFFPTLGSVLLLRKRSLFLLNVTDARTEDAIQYHRTTLADAIGRGIHLNHGNTRQPVQFIEGLGAAVQGNVITKKEVISKIDLVAKSKNGEAFDTEFASHLPEICGNRSHSEDPFEGTTVSISQIAQHNHLISHVINKIFAVKLDSDSIGLLKGLEIQFVPPRTFHWLIQHNVMTLRRIQLALKQTGVLSATEELHQCALVEALATFDYSLETLISLLAGPTPLTTREVACATRFALDVLQQSQNLSNLRLLTATEMDIGSDAGDHDEDMNGDSTLEPEKDADKIHDAQSAMKVCLARLSICNDSDVRGALSQELSTLHLLSLVDFLRAELAGGGWFSHHSDDARPDEDFYQDDSQINVMIKILNSAIDALGTGAWLNSASSDEYARKIEWMRAETSAALEGIEEATYLRGLLHEALLFVKRAPPRSSIQKAPTLKNSAIGVSRPVKMSKDDSEDDALPLGLRPRDRVESRVLKDGKEVTRSRREKEYLKSKIVGAYSIERIMI